MKSVDVNDASENDNAKATGGAGELLRKGFAKCTRLRPILLLAAATTGTKSAGELPPVEIRICWRR